MNRPNKIRPSLVEIMGSIKFSRERAASSQVAEPHAEFARLQEHTHRKRHSEDAQVIRSAN